MTSRENKNMSSEELTGSQTALKSKTIQGNVLSILATIGTVALLVGNGVPSEILLPALASAGGSVWGNVLSIFGRLSSTKKIK